RLSPKRTTPLPPRRKSRQSPALRGASPPPSRRLRPSPLLPRLSPRLRRKPPTARRTSRSVSAGGSARAFSRLLLPAFVSGAVFPPWASCPRLAHRDRETEAPSRNLPPHSGEGLGADTDLR